MLFRILLGVVILAPLPFGSNRAWAWDLLGVLIALLGIAWSISMLLQKARAYRLLRQLYWPVALFCAAVLWGLAQALPGWVDPLANPIWAQARAVLQMPFPGFISIAPEDTLTACMRLLAYGLVFLMAVQHCEASENARKLFQWFAFGGFCYAVYSLVNYFGGYKKILWYDGVYTGVSGTFINSNSYATYAGLTVLCCMPRLFEAVSASAQYGLKTNFGKQYFIEQFIRQGWFVLANLIVSVTALLLTQSRSGCLSVFIGFVGLFGLLALLKRKQGQNFIQAGIGFLAFSFLLFQISGSQLIARFNRTGLDGEIRLNIYNATLQGIRDNPWLGVGYGTFENAFRPYRSENVTEHIKFAHNTYLENMFELGVPSALLLFIAIAWVAWQCFKGAGVRKRHALYPALGFAATLLVGMHALTDFSLQMPAIAVTYAAMLGAAYAQSFSQAFFKRQGDISVETAITKPSSKYKTNQT